MRKIVKFALAPVALALAAGAGIAATAEPAARLCRFIRLFPLGDSRLIAPMEGACDGFIYFCEN